MDMERFWAKVDKSGDCWTWTGAISSTGYGNLSYPVRRGKQAWVTPHRVVMGHLEGLIPEGMEVDHVCHDPASCPGGSGCPHRRCVNPDHLRIVTPKRNSSPERNANTRNKRSRTHCPHGHPYSETATWTGGNRLCRTCNNLKAARYHERKRQAA